MSNTAPLECANPDCRFLNGPEARACARCGRDLGSSRAGRAASGESGAAQGGALEEATFEPFSPYRLRRAQNWFVLGLTYASYYLCRYNLGAVAPELKAGLSFNNEQYGAIQASRDGAYGIGQFFNGLFADRVGGKQAMTIGALGTVVLNLAFGFTAWSHFVWMFYILFVIRAADGYVQAFGAPGMVKINAAWFRRRERGGFAGIFGGMIQLGAIGANQLAALLASGAIIPLVFYSITIPKLDWRYAFIIPPVIVALMVVLLNLLVKNHPEDAGHRVRHEDEKAGENIHERLHVAQVFWAIASNPVIWFVAVAYMCTGFVRRGVESWFAIYLNEVWGAGKTSHMYWILAVFLPISAFVGSLSSGFVSDRYLKGRRAPVAATLYSAEAVLILLGIWASFNYHVMTPTLSIALLLAISLTCNSTHSILGTAAVMDLGGRKMSGFSLGLVNMFQYAGAVLATWGVGRLIDRYSPYFPNAAKAVTSAAATSAPAAPQFSSVAAAASTQPMVVFSPTVWFLSMLPFALLGASLMLYLTVRHRGTNTRGT
ncbi:MAG: MFS transporter [Phycisphaerae bacterium]